MASFFYLTPVLGGPGAPRYPVTDERQLIGRSELAHIALLEPTVSREHAAVFCTREGVKLEDLESKHGTYVNSKRISDKILKVGDIVVFGLSLVLRLEETDHPLDPPPTLAASEPETTVSLVETPRHRRPSDRGGGGRAAQVTVTRAAPAPSSNDIDRMREATLRARKLATVGARVSAMLPGTHRGLTDISASLRRGEDPQESLAQLDMIIARISELLGDCQIPRPRLEPLSLFDVARRAVATVMPEASQKDVELLLGVPADIDVLTDPSRLRSALIQLLRNAADAS
ncbi:MAG: FHA domain-containing protein, partial [Deltaproteobacteria bacterium]|nr:FHA domain-containing protein [Deltaproteobacteria bacterium]